MVTRALTPFTKNAKGAGDINAISVVRGMGDHNSSAGQFVSPRSGRCGLGLGWEWRENAASRHLRRSQVFDIRVQYAFYGCSVQGKYFCLFLRTLKQLLTQDYIILNHGFSLNHGL